MHRDKHHDEHNEKLDKKILAELEEQERVDKQILSELHRLTHPRLSVIKIAFTHPVTKGVRHMPPVQGPAVLTTAGQITTASVLGFDQFGQPMPADFTMPSITFTSVDVSAPPPPAAAPKEGREKSTRAKAEVAGAIVNFSDNGDGTATVGAVANGVNNITATVTSAEGLALSDTETVTVAIVIVPPPTPVLSSIKVAFTDAGGGPVTGAPAADTRTPNQKLAR